MRRIGAGSALYVYRHRGGAWQLATADEAATPCAHASCARFAYAATLVGASESDGPYVLTTYEPFDEGGSHPPAFEYRVLAIGVDPLAPRILLAQRAGILTFEDDVTDVTVRASGFDIRYVREERTWCGPGRWRVRACEAVARYSTRGGRVRLQAATTVRGPCEVYRQGC